MIDRHLDTQAIEARHGSGAVAKRPLTLVRGERSTVYDEAGRAYLDLTSGQGVALVGHGHPRVVAAIAQQAGTLITCSESFYNDRRAELYTLLADLMPDGLDRFFLCNSGTEATEAALKAARLLTGRMQVVAARRGFHGRTLGALGLTWNKDYREPFAGWTPNGITHITYDDLASAEVAITTDTAAVVIEPIQGEGGVHPASDDFLRGLRELCDRVGALLVMDEIQTGLGRAGDWFAHARSGSVPDMIILGKGIAGGVPMGAIAWRGALGTLPAGSHGSTFGGNPLACAAAVATLGILRDDDLPVRSAELGERLITHLRSLNLLGVRAIRGRGLMIGLELRDRVTPILQGLQARGVLALPAGATVLRLLPPLVVTWDELEGAADAIAAVLTEHEKSPA